MSTSEKLKNNKNAQVWTEETSLNLFHKALELSKRKTDYIINGNKVQGYEFHFIGEIATSDELDTYADVFKYVKEAQPITLDLYLKLKSKLESNCFSDSKKGIIKEATAIMNLKSNYNWTDRHQSDVTSNGKEVGTSDSVLKILDRLQK